MPQRDTLLSDFRQVLAEFYQAGRRDNLPWRKIGPNGIIDPYVIYVSEVMLQQTQVSRVVPIFERFIKKFPDLMTLSRAELGDVLAEWKGLGYNRRAKYLRDGASRIVKDYNGKIPADTEYLNSLPGIGPNTAGAIAVYAFNKPAIFIETNIRTVYIYHFFNNRESIKDSEILGLLKDTLDLENPREFYWSLMDYGTALKLQTKLPHRKSSGYRKQSSFEGSQRQLRSKILYLVHEKPIRSSSLHHLVGDPRSYDAVESLQKEGFILEADGLLTIAQ